MVNRKLPPAAPVPINFTRADPAALATFDPSTKRCTMNCGPHADDPRSREERAFLCDECEMMAPATSAAPPGAIDEALERLRYVQWHKAEYGRYPVPVYAEHLKIWMGAKRDAAAEGGGA